MVATLVDVLTCMCGTRARESFGFARVCPDRLIDMECVDTAYSIATRGLYTGLNRVIAWIGAWRRTHLADRAHARAGR